MKDTKVSLKECPFCGSEDLDIVNFSSSVKCKGCGMMCTMSMGWVKASGVKVQNRLNALEMCWNRRADD